jgi:hypothetical protein
MKNTDKGNYINKYRKSYRYGFLFYFLNLVKRTLHKIIFLKLIVYTGNISTRQQKCKGAKERNYFRENRWHQTVSNLTHR